MKSNIINTQLESVTQGVFNFLQVETLKVDNQSDIVRIKILADTNYAKQSKAVIEKTSNVGWIEIHHLLPYNNMFNNKTIINIKDIEPYISKLCQDLREVAEKILFHF